MILTIIINNKTIFIIIFPWVGREEWALNQTTTSAMIMTLCAVKCATDVNNSLKNDNAIIEFLLIALSVPTPEK